MQLKLEDIIKTKAEIEKLGHTIENNIIEYIDINTIAHFGNLTCFEIICNNICPLSGYNNTQNLGFMIRAFIELFDLSKEDGVSFRYIKKIPCRLILENDGGWGSKCIGFGNFMEDKFVFTADFVKINEL